MIKEVKEVKEVKYGVGKDAHNWILTKTTIFVDESKKIENVSYHANLEALKRKAVNKMLLVYGLEELLECEKQLLLMDADIMRLDQKIKELKGL